MVNYIKKISTLIKPLGEDMRSQHLSLATAESCTGGGLAYFISIEPACSCVLERGYVTYSNQAKESVLHVTLNTLHIFGAVSKEVAQQMASGALNASNAQIAIATTGIAGEDFHPPQNKGLLWIACVGTNKKSTIKNFHIAGNREEFVYRSILASLKLTHTFVKNFY